MNLKDHIAEVPDFPDPGILFYDISPLLAHPAAWQETVNQLAQAVKSHDPDVLADHLLKWVPQFCGRIKAETTLEYFRALADCLSTFLSEFEADVAMPESVTSLMGEGQIDAKA